MRNRCTYAERKELQYQQRYSRFSLSDSSATTDDDCQRAGGREGKSVFWRNGEKEESARGWREREMFRTANGAAECRSVEEGGDARRKKDFRVCVGKNNRLFVHFEC